MGTNRIAVYLPTKDDFETFLKFYENPKGLSLEIWEKYINKFCVDLGDGCYAYKNWYENNNYTIITLQYYIKQFHEVIEVDETPQHYNTGTFDVIDFCNAYKLNFNRGNIVKYVARAGKKGSELEDLEKALDYIKREIKFLKDGHNGSDN